MSSLVKANTKNQSGSSLSPPGWLSAFRCLLDQFSLPSDTRGMKADEALSSILVSVGRGGRMMEINFPKCQKCGTGVLVPLSDYGRNGASIMYKAWVCTNPDCGFNLRIDNGEVSIGKDVVQSYK